MKHLEIVEGSTLMVDYQFQHASDNKNNVANLLN